MRPFEPTPPFDPLPEPPLDAPPVAEITVIGATPKDDVPATPPTVKGCGPGNDGAGYVLIAVPPPPPPEPTMLFPEEPDGPPLPPPPTTVTLIDLTVAGFVHVLEPVYTFITTTPLAPAVVCVVPSLKVIAVGDIEVAMISPC